MPCAAVIPLLRWEQLLAKPARGKEQEDEVLVLRLEGRELFLEWRVGLGVERIEFCRA